MTQRSCFHLAQVNIAWAKAPLEDPLMAEFSAQIEQVNALADAAPGFVWRWKSGEADEPASDDPSLLFNLSVWESVEMLRDYVYRGGHTRPFAARQNWFHPPQGPHLALWWIPGGHIPSTGEALARLELLATHPPGPASFTFRQPFDAPDSPPTAGEAGDIGYEGRFFRSRANTANGDVTADVIFSYRQSGGRVWATYDGANVRFGTLVASSDAHGVLDARYSHLNAAGDWRTGRCTTTPEQLPGGRLRLHETWQWTNGDCSHGASVVEEIA
jgi:hypothetical protein